VGKLPGLNKLKINENSKGLLTAGVADKSKILVLILSFFSC
jgi:hypothetical protein